VAATVADKGQKRQVSEYFRQKKRKKKKKKFNLKQIQQMKNQRVAEIETLKYSRQTCCKI